MKSSFIGSMYRGVYYTLWKAAKLPFDINNHILHGDVHSVHHGTSYNHVEGEMGEQMYEDLCQDTALLLETICYCQNELDLVRKSLQATRRRLNPSFIETEQKKRLINHDFLMLKIKPGKQDEPPFHILAEKVAGGGDGSQPGIHISIHGDLDDIQDIERRCCLHRIECGSHIGLGALIAILKKKNPDYDARDENCWDYARMTTKWLLEACIEALACEECEKYWELHWELEHLEANLVKKHASNTAMRMVKYAKTNVHNILHRCAAVLVAASSASKL